MEMFLFGSRGQLFDRAPQFRALAAAALAGVGHAAPRPARVKAAVLPTGGAQGERRQPVVACSTAWATASDTAAMPP